MGDSKKEKSINGNKIKRNQKRQKRRCEPVMMQETNLLSRGKPTLAMQMSMKKKKTPK